MLHFNVTLREGKKRYLDVYRSFPSAEEQTRIKIHRRRLEIHRNDELGRYKSQYRHGFVSFRFVPLFFLPFPFFFLSQTQFSRGVDSRSTRSRTAKTLKPTYGWPGNFTAHELDSCRHVASARSKLPDPIPSFPEIGTPLEKSIKSSPLPLSFHFSASAPPLRNEYHRW